MVGTHVIAHLHGLARINWANPPAWAAAWDVSTAVGMPTPRNTPGEATSPGPAPQPSLAAPVSRPVVAAFNPAMRRAGRVLA